MDQVSQDYIRYLLEQRAQLELQVLKLTQELKKLNEDKQERSSPPKSGS